METQLNSKQMPVTHKINRIRKEQIQNMINHYRNNQLKYINDNLMIDDAHSIWFDLPTLKNFIQNIEAEAQKKNADITEQDLGIRFYYAAYPDTVEDRSVPENYANRHTLVLIPTHKRKDDNGELLNFDFNPSDSPDDNGSQGTLALTSGKSGSAMAQNHGNLIPPTTPTAESY